MRNVLVTGSTSGFGRLIAEEFLKNGDRVIATGRRLDQRREIFAELRMTAAERLIELSLDVADPSSRVALLAELERRSLDIDILVNNAGLGLFGAFEETSEAQMRAHFEVNFFGAALLTRDLLPSLRRRQGRIFNLSSVFGFTGFPLTSIYCAAKHAIEGWSESLALELRPHGVRVTLVQPGGYRTRFAQNTVWAEEVLDPANSPYRVQTLNYEKLREKLTTRPNFQDPLEVAQGVVRAATLRHPPLRLTFGRDAQGTRLLRALLPRRLFHFVMGLMARRLFENGKSTD